MTQENSNKRNLSQKFTTYIEKHRIFQLFQELSMMLLIKKPDDHVLFLKQSIYHAARRLDVPRVIIIAPPDYDKNSLALKLQKKLNIPLITMSDISDFPDNASLCDPDNYAIENLRLILMKYMKVEHDGWVFVDFPRSESEAHFLQRSGMIPTHVIEIISPDSTESITDPRGKEYFKELLGLRRVYSPFLMKIKTDGKEIEEIVEQCLKIVKCRKYSRAPTILRILFIDTIDAERGRDLARYIAEIFNVVCIHFSDLVEQISLQESDLGNKIRNLLYEKHLLNPEFKKEIFEHFISQSVAMKQGWVMTDFPSTVEEFKHLDVSDYSPNRVMIIATKDHLIKHETPPDTSTESSSSSDKTILCDCNGEEDASLEGMIKYAGETAIILEDTSDMKRLKEKIDYYLMQPPSSAPPRQPRLTDRVQSDEVEYDPDEEPCKKLLNEIRNPEPELCLI